MQQIKKVKIVCLPDIHFIVAPNMKFLKVNGILSVSATKRIVKHLMEVA